MMKDTTMRAMAKRRAMLEKYAAKRSAMAKKHTVKKYAAKRSAMAKRYTVAATVRACTFTVRAQSKEQAAQLAAARLYPGQPRLYVTDQLRVPDYVVRRGIFYVRRDRQGQTLEELKITKEGNTP